MATYTAGIKVQVENATQFKSDLQNLTQKSKELNSQMKAVATQADNEDDKLKTLSEQMENQRSIIQKLTSNLEAQENKLSELETQLTAAKNAYSESQTNVKSLNEQLSEEKTILEELEKKLNSAKEEYGENSDEVKELTEAYEAQEKKVESLNTDLTTATTEQANNEKQVSKLTTAVTNQETAISKSRTAINNATADLNEMGEEAESVGEEVETSFTDLAGILTSLGLKEIIEGISEAISECVATAADFESQMSTVEALTGASADELEALEEKAKSLGSTTVYTATEAAEALEYMALAGWSTEEMLEGVDAVLNLAAASSMDLGEASDIVTDYLTAFNLTAADAENFVDQMTYAMSNSNTTTEELGEAYKNCASTAASMGFSVEDTTAALMVMANAGVKGSEAGSGLSTIMTRLATNTKSCEDAISEYTEELLGYEFSMYDANGEMRDMSDILSELGELWPLLTDEQQANLSKVIAGTNQYSKFQTLMSGLVDTTEEGTSSFEAYAAALAACSGTASEMAETQLDNLSGSMTLLESAADGLKTTIGEQLSPAIQSVVDAGSSVINWINDFLEEHPNVTAAFTAVAVAVGVLSAALIVVATVSIPAVQTAFEALKATISSNPIGLAITLITAAVAAIATFAATATANSETAISEAKAEKKAVEELIDAYEDLEEETKEENQAVSDMVDELDSLMSVSDKSTAQTYKIQAIVEDLNEEIEDLNLTYDEETDTLNMTTDAIKRQSEAYQEQESLAQITEQILALETELSNIEAERAENEERLVEVQEEIADVTDKILAGEANWEVTLADLQAEETDLTRAIKKQTETCEELEAELGTLSEEAENYSDTIDTTTATEEDITEYVNNIITELETLNTEYMESYDAAYESLQGQFDLWDDLSDQAAMSTDEIWAALDSQKTYWQEYSDNLADLNSRNIEGLDEFVASVADGTTDSASYIAGLTEMTDEELEKYLAEWQEMQETSISDSAAYIADMETGYSEMSEDILEELITLFEDADLSEEAKQAAIDTLEGYSEGVNAETADTTITIKEWATTILNKAKSVLGIASPSTKFKAIGEQSMQGFINGVNSKSSTVSSTVKSMAETALSKFKNNISVSSMKTLGANVIQGFINGLSAKSSSLYQKLTSIASTALSKFKNVLGISSPSVEFASVGEFAMLGYIKGITSEENEVVEVMEDMAKIALDTFNTEYNRGFNTQALSLNGAAALINGNTGANANVINSSNTNNITMNVYAQEGQDVNALANIVVNKINNQIRRTGAVYG